MPNANDRKILEKLLQASEEEMDAHELETILENELNKPAEEIDAALIDDLMEILQPVEMTARQQQQTWKNIQKKLSPKTNHKRLIRRISAIAAVLVLLCGFAFKPATADPWQFLKRLLKPVAETFGIYLNYSESDPVETPSVTTYGISEDETMSMIHYDLNEIPDTYNGYAIKPDWLPDGATFVDGSSFSEICMQKYALRYRLNQHDLCLTVAIHTLTGAVANYEYERVAEVAEERLIGSRMVTFYQNTDSNQDTQYVSWIDGSAHYSIRGTLSIEDVEHIILTFAAPLSE